MPTKITKEVREIMDLHRGYKSAFRRGVKVLSDEDLESRLALIPEDTRDLTGKWLGDPIPGDKRRQDAKVR